MRYLHSSKLPNHVIWLVALRVKGRVDQFDWTRRQTISERSEHPSGEIAWHCFQIGFEVVGYLGSLLVMISVCYDIIMNCILMLFPN